MQVIYRYDAPSQFTAKERDAESGLDNFGKRYDASSLGRFMTTAPVVITTERLMNPQQLNLYAYVANNPLRFIDPTGEILQCVGDAKSQSQCFADLQQIAGDAKDRLSMDAKTGVISFDTKDLDLSKNEGASLVNNLVGSKNTYDFSVGPTIMTDKGPVRVDHIGTDMANLPAFSDQRQIGNPPAGVSDILDIYFNNPNMTRMSNTNLQVAPEWTVAFHELAEAYEKIDGGKGGSYAAGHETRSYDARLRLTGITDGSIYSVTIPTYAPDGDVLAANDSVNGNWTYAYDAFNRLTGSNQNSGTNIYSYLYDRFGNRWNQNVTHGSGPGPGYGFDANNHIVSGYGVTYDAAGDTADDGTTTYTYDAEGRVTAAVNGASGTSTYIYDAEGRRNQKTTAAGGTVNFVYDLGGHEVAQMNSAGAWTRGEVYAGGRHVATYTGTGGTTYFIHSDWLGTERARSAVNGTSAETCTRLPFGDWLTCIGSDVSPMHFTGKEHDWETGLENFGARYDSSAIGRFMTPDWSAKPQGVPYATFDDPQSLNLYTFTRDNPTTEVDDNGHCIDGISTWVCVVVVAAVVSAGAAAIWHEWRKFQTQHEKSEHDAFDKAYSCAMDSNASCTEQDLRGSDQARINTYVDGGALAIKQTFPSAGLPTSPQDMAVDQAKDYVIDRMINNAKVNAGRQVCPGCSPPPKESDPINQVQAPPPPPTESVTQAPTQPPLMQQ